MYRSREHPSLMRMSEEISPDSQCKANTLVNGYKVPKSAPNKVHTHRKHHIIILMIVERTCKGTCHRLLDIPRTIPKGKRIPQTAHWRSMWIHKIASIGALRSSSVNSAWWPWAYATGTAEMARARRYALRRCLIAIAATTEKRRSADCVRQRVEVCVE